MEVKQVKFSDLSQITYRMFLYEGTPAEGRVKGAQYLLIEFSGRHGVGSGGNGDSLFMATVVKAATNVWYVRGLILDLSGLSYEWGNGIAHVLVAGKAMRGVNFPTAVVVSEKCGPALESLGPWYRGHVMSGGQKQWLFDGVDSALRHVAAQTDAGEAEEEQRKKNIILWPK